MNTMDMGYHELITGPWPSNEVKGKLLANTSGQLSGYTVAMVLHDKGSDIEIFHVIACNRFDALVKAAATMLAEGKRVPRWTEGYEYLHQQCYDVVAVAGFVKMDGYESPLDEQLSKKLLAEEEAIDEAEKT